MIRNTSKNQKLCWLLFLLYLIGLLYFTFFAESLGRGSIADGDVAARFNLMPFREIRRFWVYRERLGMRAFVLNVFGNIIAFMPCGFLLAVISRRCREVSGAVVITWFISFLIECTQLVLRVGSFDVDDMLLNTLGGLLGYLTFRLLQRGRAKRRAEHRAERERRSVHIRRIDLAELMEEEKEAETEREADWEPESGSAAEE